MVSVGRLTPVNHWVGRDGHTVRAVVVHITDGDTASSAVTWFHDPDSLVSAHYVIDKDGTIYRAVLEKDAAWANGILQIPNTANPIIARWVNLGINPNKETVSIEVAGRPGAPWPAAQRDALVWLLADVCRRWALTPDRTHIIGHYEITGIDRAHCPGLTPEQWTALVADVAAWQAGAPGDDDAARMEARYQANAAALGAKRFSGRLERDFYSGSVLVCDGGVVTPDGHDLSGNIMDDWVGLGISSETLVRY